MSSRSFRLETRSRARDEIKKIMQTVEKVRKWEKKWIDLGLSNSLKVYKWVPIREENKDDEDEDDDKENEPVEILENTAAPSPPEQPMRTGSTDGELPELTTITQTLPMPDIQMNSQRFMSELGPPDMLLVSDEGGEKKPPSLEPAATAPPDTVSTVRGDASELTSMLHPSAEESKNEDVSTAAAVPVNVEVEQNKPQEEEGKEVVESERVAPIMKDTTTSSEGQQETRSEETLDQEVGKPGQQLIEGTVISKAAEVGDSGTTQTQQARDIEMRVDRPSRDQERRHSSSTPSPKNIKKSRSRSRSPH